MKLGQLASLLFLGLVIVVGFISLSDSQKASRLRTQLAVWQYFADDTGAPSQPSTDLQESYAYTEATNSGPPKSSNRPLSWNTSSDSVSNSSSPRVSGTSRIGTYVIQDGDTLGSIAKKHGVPRSKLLESNRLSEGQPIYIGETLVIPGIVGTGKVVGNPELAPEKKNVVVGDTMPKSDAGRSYHTVVKGDTLMALSRKYNTSIDSIKTANGLLSDVISLGQRLRIPSNNSGPPDTTTQTTSTPHAKPDNQEKTYEYDNELLRSDETYGYYTVRKGDNLYALARDFFTSMAELQRLNRLGNSTLLYPGDEIIVPTGKYSEYHNSSQEDRNDTAPDDRVPPSEDSELVYFVSAIPRSAEEVKTEVAVEGANAKNVQTGHVNEREIQIITLIFPEDSNNSSSESPEVEDGDENESASPPTRSQPE